jgi:hypothetical protein
MNLKLSVIGLVITSLFGSLAFANPLLDSAAALIPQDPTHPVAALAQNDTETMAGVPASKPDPEVTGSSASGESQAAVMDQNGRWQVIKKPKTSTAEEETVNFKSWLPKENEPAKKKGHTATSSRANVPQPMAEPTAIVSPSSTPAQPSSLPKGQGANVPQPMAKPSAVTPVPTSQEKTQPVANVPQPQGIPTAVSPLPRTGGTPQTVTTTPVEDSPKPMVEPVPVNSVPQTPGTMAPITVPNSDNLPATTVAP